MSNQPKIFFRDGFGGVHNSLFCPGLNGQLNACIGRNGGPAGFDRYARGYFEAGRRLVASLKEDPYWVDCVIYPLVMVYRHGIETALKHLGRMLPVICGEETEVKLTHKLLDNWKIVRRYLSQIEVDKEELEQVESKLKELIQIDPNSEAFRYPEAKDGTLHLQETSLINVEVFGEGMAYLAQFFEMCCHWVDYLYDNCLEAKQEERELEREMAKYYGWE